MTTDVALVTANAQRLDVLRDAVHYFRSLVSIGNLYFGSKPKGGGLSASGAIEDVAIHVYLPESLKAEERARLYKEIARLAKGVAGAEAKLANPKFATGAPEAIVAAERERLAKMQTELASLRGRREALG